jgi:flavin-dependent dehydrogenase
MQLEDNYDVVIIGAGPAGSVSAALLNKAGFRVAVLERTNFPRFVIGESLLPVCNDVLQEAGLFDRVSKQGYQVKTGAVFLRGDDRCEYDFADQFTNGATWTWQVPRAHFDNVLVEGIKEQGVPVFFEHGVADVQVGDSPRVSVDTPDGESTQAPRKSMFGHFTGEKRPEGADAGRIWIVVHELGAWLWVIPFSDGRTSFGAVASPEFYDQFPDDPEECLKAIIATDPNASSRLADAELQFGPRSVEGYSVGVKQLYGDGYCLVGNATEFLDPVFSSGVSLALQSASRASSTLIRHLNGETVDWETDYSEFMYRGIDTFRTFVDAWYDETLYKVFFTKTFNAQLKRMVCSTLAGYVWDLENPFVKNHGRKLSQLIRIIESTEVA